MCLIDKADAKIYLLSVGVCEQTPHETAILCPCCGEFGLTYEGDEGWVHDNCASVYSTSELVEILQGIVSS